MPVATRAVNIFFAPRLKAIDDFRRRPAAVQARQLDYLLGKGRDTVFGREHGLAAVKNVEAFQQSVPVRDYDAFAPWAMRAMEGERGAIWPSPIRWFAKSSGTTGAKSKYIPVAREGLRDSHMRGPRDVIAFFAHNNPRTRVFGGRTLTLGGSKRVEREGGDVWTGDLSAILLANTPAWANLRRVPGVETALIPDFDEKVRRICEESVNKDVRAFAGVPSWNLVLMNRVLEYTGKSDLLEVWPRMELFVHGGMSFKPYREEYRRLIPSDGMKYMETYNASEGFFAIADDPARDDMLLMLDYGVYYEFVPMSSLGDPDAAVPVEGVRRGVNYAMVITNSNGLWRYMIGDTVEFTSLAPHRIRITGRTSHYINAFGEEIVIANAENALRAACDATGAEVGEFTAAPVYMEGAGQGRHEWVVEFSREPDSAERFRDALDAALQGLNSDYEAKRFKNTTLQAPLITVVAPGTFMEWMRRRGKLGGQNKVPRLFNDRTYVEQLREITGIK